MLCEECACARRFLAGLNRVAIGAMVDWLVQAPPRARPGPTACASRSSGFYTGDVPSDDLMPALSALDEALASQSASAGARRRPDPAQRCSTESSKRGRSRLRTPRSRASSSRTFPRRCAAPRSSRRSRGSPRGVLERLPHIAGRAVGLFLSVGSAESRRRSAAVAAGAARELARAAPHTPSSSCATTRASPSGHSPCSGASRVDGAAVLIAGVDDESAEKAAEFAEKVQIPVADCLRVPLAEKVVAAVSSWDPTRAPRPKRSAALLGAGKQRPVRVGVGGVSCESRRRLRGAISASRSATGRSRRSTA